MKFEQTNIDGAYIIELEPIADERGFFSRMICKQQFSDHDLDSEFVQFNTSYSKYKNTLRGLHYQIGDAAETKVIKCINGALLDVIVDLRKNSKTYKNIVQFELTAENRKMLYVPKGCAHGFYTLQGDTEMIYFVSNYYNGAKERTLRWNDKEFNIQWPSTPQTVSDKDNAAPDFSEEWHLPQI